MIIRLDKSINLLYRFLVISILLMSLLISSVNADKINFFNNISSIVNLGFCKIHIFYLFFPLAVFITIVFILNKKLINKNSILTLIILYTIYLVVHFVIAFIRGADISSGFISIPLYPIFALPFLRKNWNFNADILYLLKKTKLFIYLAIIIGLISLVVGRNNSFHDLLFFSLLLLSYNFFEKRNSKYVLLVVLLAVLSGFRLTWMFTFVFAVILAIFYNLKRLKLHKIIFLSLTILLFVAFVASIIFTQFNAVFKLPYKERFARDELLRATGRTAFWQKYIYQYEGSPLELLFGHGGGFIYTISDGNRVYFLSHLHNIFFDEFYKRGLVGLLLLSSIIVITFKARSPTYLKIFFVLFLIFGQSEVIIFMGVLGVAFWMIVGMLNNTPKNEILMYENK